MKIILASFNSLFLEIASQTRPLLFAAVVVATATPFPIAAAPGDVDTSRDEDPSLTIRNTGLAGDPSSQAFLPMAGVPGLDAVGTVGPSIDNILPPRKPRVGPNNWRTEIAFPNVVFGELKGVVAEPRSKFIHIVERYGKVFRVDSTDRSTTIKTLVLNVQSLVNGELNGGLRSVVFHPEFNQPASANRDYIYVFYSTDSTKTGFTRKNGAFFYRLSRFTRNAAGQFPLGSELVMIQQTARDRGAHMGGGLTFAGAGFLIVTWGDLEYYPDVVDVPFYQDAQRIDRIFQAAVLRIDVNSTGGGISSPPTRTLQGNTGPKAMPGTSQSCLPDHNYYHVDNFSGVGYFIPNDNYFKLHPPPPGSSSFPDTPVHGPALEEHQALGVRNPWRLATDPATGEVAMFVVGSNLPEYTFEEVEMLVPGGNYGWPFREGDKSQTDETGRTKPPSQYAPVYLGIPTDPLRWYSHDYGNVSVGGVFYRGAKFPSLAGKLIYADHGSGRIWAVDPYSPGKQTTDNSEQLVQSLYEVRQMCTDPTGNEIYLASSGQIYWLCDASSTVPEPPALLSNAGAFVDMTSLTTHAGLIPYVPAAELWSDRAIKRRWMAVPNHRGIPGQFDLASEQVIFSENGEWDFPNGTTFVKHFDLPLDEADPNNPLKQRRVETRFLVRGDDGQFFAFTYKWRPDGSEADLLAEANTEKITVTRADGSVYVQTWNFPSRAQCFECHQQGAGYVLGLKTRQLNHDLRYPETGRTSHQLLTLNHLGMFDQTLDESAFPGYLACNSMEDTGVPLEQRVRSYLDSNCSMCHRPGSIAGLSRFDARLTTPLWLANIIGANPNASNLGLREPKLIKPGDPANSILYVRSSFIGVGQMPPLGRSHIDVNYLKVLSDWIKQIGLPNYNQWATAMGVTGGIGADDDRDQVSNVAEFVVGLNAVISDAEQMPGLTRAAGRLVFTLPIQGDALADGIAVGIEDSTDLVRWVRAGSPESSLEILNDTASPGVDGVLQVRFLPGLSAGFLRFFVSPPSP